MGNIEKELEELDLSIGLIKTMGLLARSYSGLTQKEKIVFLKKGRNPTITTDNDTKEDALTVKKFFYSFKDCFNGGDTLYCKKTFLEYENWCHDLNINCVEKARFYELATKIHGIKIKRNSKNRFFDIDLNLDGNTGINKFLRYISKGRYPYFEYNRRKIYNNYVDWCKSNSSTCLLSSDFADSMKNHDAVEFGRNSESSFYRINFKTEKTKDILKIKLTNPDSLF